MAKLTELGSANFEKEVLDEKTCAVVVDFYSHTCPHCKKLSPEFEAASEADENDVKYAKVAAQDYVEIFRKFGVSGVPTLIVFKNGEEVTRESGFKTRAEIQEFVAQHC